jgi:hypothetical protein
LEAITGQGEIVLRPSKVKWLGVGLVCGVFVLIFVFLFGDDERGIRYMGTGFCGLGVLVAVLQLVGGSYLKLTANGIEERALFRVHRTAWKDVRGFTVYALRTRGVKTSEHVGFDYVPEYPARRRMRAVNKGLTGCEAGLADTYGMTAGDLANLLEEWRRKEMAGRE